MKKAWKLNPEEQELMPLVVQILNHRTKKNVFSNPEIRQVLAQFGYEKVEAPSIRKIVYNIRQQGLTTLLIANSEGYYKATNIQEVESWLQTHKSKIEAMLSTLESIESQFKVERSKLKDGNSELLGQISIFDVIDENY